MSVETDEVGPGWDGVNPPVKGGGNRKDGPSLFMKLEPREEPYHVRLACTPISFRKHRWAFRSLRQWPISPATDPSEKDADIAWRDGKFMPVTRFAAFVFDRDTENRLRILEESGEVFGPIGNHAHATKVNAASATKGWDWIILVKENVDSNGKKSRSYAVTIDTSKNGPTPFTEDEINALENPKFQRSELETRYFVKSTPEEIQDLWEQLPISARINESRNKGGNTERAPAKTATKTPVETPVEPPAEKPSATKPAVAAKPTAPVVEATPEAEVKDDSFLADEDQPADSEPADSEPAAEGDDQPARWF